MLLGRLSCFALCVFVVRGAEPFSLKLPDLSGAWFENGAVIHVPPDKNAEGENQRSRPWNKVRVARRRATRNWRISGRGS